LFLSGDLTLEFCSALPAFKNNMEVDVDMVDNDIYNNKQYWDNFVERVDQLIIPPERRTKNYRSKYYIKNPKNLGYFKKLIQKFEAQDLSYIRRRRMRDIFLFVCYHTENDLKSLDEMILRG